MPTLQVDCLELVYVTRTYEVDVEDPADAERAARYGEGKLVDEQVGETYRFCQVLCVSDENGVEVKAR
jgi:hypothetical protein